MHKTNRFQIIFSLLALFTRIVFAAVPYTPSHVFLSPRHNGSLAYLLLSKPSAQDGTEFVSLNLSGHIDPKNPQYSTLSQPTQFTSDNDAAAFVPMMDHDGILKIYAGSCHTSASAGAVWHFNPDNSSSTGDGVWKTSPLDLAGSTAGEVVRGPNYLAAGFVYSTYNGSFSSAYSFGGMCPFHTSSGQSWVSAANYSRSMVVLSPSDADMDTYDAGITAARGAPIAEAGFTITPLQASYSTTSTGKVLQQQSFVLVGGHTQHAFINMSGIALFSLPEGSWTYANIGTQEDMGRSDLAIRDLPQVESRSGHSAVLSPDGSKVIVYGGWVGDTDTPATPQLAILEIDEDYGGSGPWTWSVPSQKGIGLPQGSGIFGHGATILPGDIMMIVGGYRISRFSSKRSTSEPVPNSDVYFYNITSDSWITSYTNPYQQNQKESGSNSGPLSSTSQKAGLGAGLGVGLAAAAGVMMIFFLHSRRRRAHRKSREQELRQLALGAERSHFWSEPDMSSSIRSPMTELRKPASRSLFPDNAYPWAGNRGFGDGPSLRDTGGSDAERTGLFMEIPSPTRGLRKSMHSRPYRYQPAGRYDDPRRGCVSGNIHPIDERDEDEANLTEHRDLAGEGSSRRDSKASQTGDPFADPASSPLLRMSPNKELQSWADDIEPIFDCGSLDEGPSVSPNKSERTSSSLSESSTSAHSVFARNASSNVSEKYTAHSQQPGIPTLNRAFNVADESHQPPENVTSQSSCSQNQGQSSQGSISFPFERTRTADSFSTAHTSFPSLQAEGELLLDRGPEWATPPESLVKVASGSKVRALGWIGNVRRALVGAGKEGHIDRSLAASPATPRSDRRSIASDPLNEVEYRSNIPRRAVSTSAAALRRKQGAKDWDADKRIPGESSKFLSRSRTVEFPMLGVERDGEERQMDDDEEEWDVEAAAEGRLVQVTFTVPKEKLRVVNAGKDEIDDDDDDDDDTEHTSVGSNTGVQQRASPE